MSIVSDRAAHPSLWLADSLARSWNAIDGSWGLCATACSTSPPPVQRSRSHAIGAVSAQAATAARSASPRGNRHRPKIAYWIEAGSPAVLEEVVVWHLRSRHA